MMKQHQQVFFQRLCLLSRLLIVGDPVTLLEDANTSSQHSEKDIGILPQLQAIDNMWKQWRSFDIAVPLEHSSSLSWSSSSVGCRNIVIEMKRDVLQYQTLTSILCTLFPVSPAMTISTSCSDAQFEEMLSTMDNIALMMIQLMEQSSVLKQLESILTKLDLDLLCNRYSHSCKDTSNLSLLHLFIYYVSKAIEAVMIRFDMISIVGETGLSTFSISCSFFLDEVFPRLNFLHERVMMIHDLLCHALDVIALEDTALLSEEALVKWLISESIHRVLHANSVPNVDMVMDLIQTLETDKGKICDMFINVTKDWEKEYEKAVSDEANRLNSQIGNPMKDSPVAHLIYG